MYSLTLTTRKLLFNTGKITIPKKGAAAVKQVINMEPLLYTPKLTLPIMPNIIKIFTRLPIWKKTALNNNDQLSFAKYWNVIFSGFFKLKLSFTSEPSILLILALWVLK